MVLNNIGNSFDTVGSVWVINDKKELNMKNALVKADSEQKIVDIQFLGSYTNTLKPTIVTVTPWDFKHNKSESLQLSYPHWMKIYTLREAIHILSVNYRLQWPMIMYMITSNLVPCGRKTIYWI